MSRTISPATLIDTDFRFNHRLLELLELDPRKIELALYEDCSPNLKEFSLQSSSNMLSPRGSVSCSRANLKSSSSLVGSNRNFQGASSSANDTNPFDLTEYKVQTGDTLDALAKRFNVPAGSIKVVNSIVGRNISNKKTLLIPPPGFNIKKYKDYLADKKKSQKEGKLGQQVIAFQERTLLQDRQQIEAYLKSARFNYYEAARRFHENSLKDEEEKSLDKKRQKSLFRVRPPYQCEGEESESDSDPNLERQKRLKKAVLQSAVKTPLCRGYRGKEEREGRVRREALERLERRRQRESLQQAGGEGIKDIGEIREVEGGDGVKG